MNYPVALTLTKFEKKDKNVCDDTPMRLLYRKENVQKAFLLFFFGMLFIFS